MNFCCLYRECCELMFDMTKTQSLKCLHSINCLATCAYHTDSLDTDFNLPYILVYYRQIEYSTKTSVTST